MGIIIYRTLLNPPSTLQSIAHQIVSLLSTHLLLCAFLTWSHHPPPHPLQPPLTSPNNGPKRRLLHQPAQEVQAGLLGRAIRRQNLPHHPFHVRLLRLHLPSHHRHRLPLQDHVPRRPHRATPTLGYRGPGTLPLADPLLYPRLLRRRRRLRHHLAEVLPADPEMGR